MTGLILRSERLQRPWAGNDPFLFCMHHLEAYPQSDGAQGVPTVHLANRDMGQDFSGKDGFSMYYGGAIPGFPAHPHRGFETVTIVPKGVVDHSDSLGATARYGDGDVQWLTAGHGIMHAEMFPLRQKDSPNPLDLYQIWLNLPAASKMVEPAFVMLWDGDIPRYVTRNATGAEACVKVVAGVYSPQEQDQPPLVPPPAAPDSWASDPRSDLAIWHIHLEAGADLILPGSKLADAVRTLYFHQGSMLVVDQQPQSGHSMIQVKPDSPLALHNGGADAIEILLLQGVPLNEPVVAQGPFVMNTAEEILQARRDFGRTQFGGWPWSESGPVHPVERGRFARYPGSDQEILPPA